MGRQDDIVFKLRLRLLEQCFHFNKSHLGSAFSSLPVIVEIFLKMKEDERFILSNGHASSALYVALEEFRGKDSTTLFQNMGDHPKRDSSYGIDCSTGSLGMGVTAAIGMAIARPSKRVFCLISDGECSEGSVWESLRFAKKHGLNNLELFCNLNGWSAYDPVEAESLAKELQFVFPRANIRFTSNFPFESIGLLAHYHKMSKSDYDQAKESICGNNL